jgi:transaldolase
VKIPYSAAGLLATRRASMEGIPVNHTLGFSARQNYLIARITRPAFVNVFLGRLNSLVADNELGSGRGVGQRATLASQAAIRKLRDEQGIQTRQIAASLRHGQQVADLAGVDVITMPPKVAREFLDSGIEPGDLKDMTAETIEPGVDWQKAGGLGVDLLWDVNDELLACADALEEERLDLFTPVRLRDFFGQHGCRDVLVKWTDGQLELSAEEGKIPDLASWAEPLARRHVGLDALMSLAGWNSFRADQEALDERVDEICPSAEK